MVPLNSTAKCKRYVIDRRPIVTGYVLVGSGEVKTEDIEVGANMDVSQYRPTSLRVVPREKLISHKSSTKKRKGQSGVLKEAMQSLLAPLRSFFVTGFEVSSKAGNV